MFPALLKHWRRQRGLSQLDLALAAGVSARHVSFLETGRSRPSAEMILRLATSLGVPLRQVNAMLEAAGHEPAYADSDEGLPAVITDALDLLVAHHEPYPLVVIDRAYAIRRLNQGAQAMFRAMLDLPDADPEQFLGLNLARLTFDPAGAQPYLANFDEAGRILLWRIQREFLDDPEDSRLRELLDDILTLPTVDPNWREVDLAVPSTPVVILHLRRGPLELRFLTMVTAFQAPQNVAVEELRVETWFPCDEATAALCKQLSAVKP